MVRVPMVPRHGVSHQPDQSDKAVHPWQQSSRKSNVCSQIWWSCCRSISDTLGSTSTECWPTLKLYKQHVGKKHQKISLWCRKGLSVFEDGSCKGYWTSTYVCCVTERCSLSASQRNVAEISAMRDGAQNETMIVESYWKTTKYWTHPLRPYNASCYSSHQCKTKQKVGGVKSIFPWSGKKKSPRCREKHAWVIQAKESILKVCQLTEFKQTKDLETVRTQTGYGTCMRHSMSQNLGRNTLSRM